MTRHQFHRAISFVTAFILSAALIMTAVGSVSVKAEAAGTTASGAGTAAATSGDTLVAALIQGSQVVVTGAITTQSEDGILHLYAQQPYESGTQGTEVAQTVNGGTT